MEVLKKYWWVLLIVALLLIGYAWSKNNPDPTKLGSGTDMSGKKKISQGEFDQRVEMMKEHIQNDPEWMAGLENQIGAMKPYTNITEAIQDAAERFISKEFYVVA